MLLQFKSVETGQADDAWSPIVDSYKIFAPEFLSAGGEGTVLHPLFGMYMPNLLNDQDPFWAKLDAGLAAGAFVPGRDTLLIDCSWESWDFRATEFEALHAKLDQRGLPLDRVAMITMCRNLRTIYDAWAGEAGLARRMRLYCFWGAAATTGRHMRSVLADDAAVRGRMLKQVLANTAHLNRERRFLCFNNMTKPWRTSTALLLSEHAADATLVSHGPLAPNEVAGLFDWMRPWFQDATDLAARLERFAARTPLTLDVETGSIAAREETTFKFDVSLYDRTAMSIVTESEMSSTGQLRLTEKTFKPLAMGHPILLCGNKWSLRRLRELGFRTFSPFVDESYDDIDDGPSRIHQVHAEMLRLAALSDKDFAEGIASLRDTAVHNALHFHHGYDALQWVELAALQTALTKDFRSMDRCE
jgi:hypothetical protein